MMSLAPITIFVYNRPWHTRQTIEALMKNKLARESELFIFSDGPKSKKDQKNVREVRRYIKEIKGFKKVTITESWKNLGLANSIIAGVTQVVNKYGKIIVLEDDLLTSPYFLKFMNDGLKLYENYKQVISIHSYVYPVEGKLPETFFLKDPGCLGWATWKMSWALFEKDGKCLLNELKRKKLTAEFNYNNSYPFTRVLREQKRGKVDSWAIRWYASAFLKDKLTLYPGKSLVFHNGGDGSGTHGGISDEFDVKLSKTPINVRKIKIEANVVAFKKYETYFKKMGFSSRRVVQLLLHDFLRPIKNVIRELIVTR